MQHVRVSGSVWSSLIFDNVRQQGDKEGFLIGEVSMQEMTNISDSQINKTTRETTVSVISHTICPKPFSFYNRSGQVDEKKLRSLLGNNYDNVVGWFRCRSGSIPDPSLREITLHHHLQATLGLPTQTFLFGIFGEGSNLNHTTITYYYNFYTCNNGLFSPQQVTIENLGDTAQSDYKQGSSLKQVTSGSDCYREILTSHKRDMIDKDGYLLGMQGIKKTNEAIHEKMKVLKDSVVESEEEVRRLIGEIKMLEQRVQMKEEEKLRTEMAAVPSPPSAMEVQEESCSKNETDQRESGQRGQGMTIEESKEPQTRNGSSERIAKEQPNSNGSNSKETGDVDPFFGNLIKDMKASIASPGKPRSNSDQVRRDRPGEGTRSERGLDRKLRSHSGSGAEQQKRTEPTGDISSQEEGRDRSDSEVESGSDSTQLPDSPPTLEPSGSQTF